MNKSPLVITTVRITESQKEFLNNSSYNQSKVFRKAIDGLMEKEKITA